MAVARSLGVDDHEVDARGLQVAGDLAPDAAEAADDVVVGERVDHPLHAPDAEQVAEVPRDEELGDCCERVEERTDAEDGEHDLHDLAGDGVRLRKAADGCGGVERPAEPVPEPDALADLQADGGDHEQRGDAEREQEDAFGEDRQLQVRGRTGAVGRAVQDAVECGHR